MEKGEELFTRSLRIRELTLGPEAPEVAESLKNLAGVLLYRGQPEEGERHLERALEILTKHLGEEHPKVGEIAEGLAVLCAEQDRPEEAERYHLQALSIWREAYGPEHPSVGLVLSNLGNVLRQLDRPAEAEERYREAIQIREATLPPGHVSLGYTHLGLGRAVRGPRAPGGSGDRVQGHSQNPRGALGLRSRHRAVGPSQSGAGAARSRSRGGSGRGGPRTGRRGPMRSARRWIFGFALGALLGAAVVLMMAWHPAPPLPEGLVPAPGTYTVRILRDTWGVPHVFGRTDPDVAYGLAWAHAEDDFATIQGSLLAARGKLATLLGPEGGPNDYMVALLRVNEQVEAGYGGLSPEVRALCEAYAAGINHYAALHPDEALTDLYPMVGEDLVRGFVHKLPLFFGLDGVLKELVEGAPPSLGDLGGARPQGSNAFAIAPSRGAGFTRLAINSHQPLEGPVAWYEAHLKSEEGWDMVGGLFPGAPLVLHGHNRHLGWAHTVNKPDLVDVYALAVDPEDDSRYLLDGESLAFEEGTAEIEVRLWGPLRWTFERPVLHTVHGPALRREDGSVYALRYSGIGEVGQLEQWYRMNRATDLESWRQAMEPRAIPMFNTVYADAEGHIYYLYNGRLPRREPGFDWQGYLPGDTSATLWQETLSLDDLPQVLDPDTGFVANCNHTPFHTTLGVENPEAEAFAPSLGIETHLTNRAHRALALFGGDEEITAEEFLAYKYDLAYSPRSWIARLRERLLALPASEAPGIAEGRRVLAAWDLGTDVDNPHAALSLLTLGAFFDDDPEAVPAEELEAALSRAVEVLEIHHGGLEVPWGQVNRLRRGTVDLPLAGGPDVLHAMYGELEEDGRLRAVAGDSYVLMVEWDAEGTVRSHSIQPYGSAVQDAESPHYTDQSAWFAERRLKPVWMDEADIRANLARETVPGEAP